nr:MAG TPA: hypothetical protein [Caudoviricetes sp.]
MVFISYYTIVSNQPHTFLPYRKVSVNYRIRNVLRDKAQ